VSIREWLIRLLGGTVSEPPKPPPPDDAPHRLVAETGPFNQPAADRLIAARDRIGQAREDGPLVRWLDAELVLALAELEVATISDKGAVDERRHQVVRVRETPDQALAEHIAMTVRPGYSRDGRLLRPQAVIAWVSAEEER
jgi:hypothetical protein